MVDNQNKVVEIVDQRVSNRFAVCKVPRGDDFKTGRVENFNFCRLGQNNVTGVRARAYRLVGKFDFRFPVPRIQIVDVAFETN